MNKIKWVGVALFASALTACGGSGGATDSSSSNSSEGSSSPQVSSSSSSSEPYAGPISNDCYKLVTDANVNWRETSLQTDQEIVQCLSETLGRPVGYGEKALGGFNPNGGSKLTIITTRDTQSVEHQIIDAMSGDEHNWIVFDKADFAEEHEVALYRTHCGSPEVLNRIDGTEAECIDYRQWCATRGFAEHDACMAEFFNNRLDQKSLPIRNPIVGANTTIDGRMSKAYFRFSGVAIGGDSSGTPTKTSNNVIISHLDFRGAGHTEDHNLDPDMVRSTGASKDIWIHKNTFDLTGDSAFDVKVGAKDITISFNKVVDVKRASLHGSSDSREINENITTTMHHNAFFTRDKHFKDFGNTGRRVPLVRRGKSHMFNNVFTNYRKDVLSVRVGASVLLEDNVFLVNQAHQEKNSVEASLSELQGNLLRDIRSDSRFTSQGNYLWFSDGTCKLNGNTQTDLTANEGGGTGNLSLNYSEDSQERIQAIRVDAGQDLVDYVHATAGTDGEIPFNSPLAGDIHYVLGLGRCSNDTHL